MITALPDGKQRLERLSDAAKDMSRVSGLTHNLYRYPARFSPQFARAAIEEFSQPGDTVLDPYMGGGTTIVEAMALGRHAIGNDLNSLAHFVAQVKTSLLNRHERGALRRWAKHVVPKLSYHAPRESVADLLDDPRTKNLGLVRARYLKKIIALAMNSVHDLPGAECQNAARLTLLSVAQWALDGRKRRTSVEEFRARIPQAAEDLLTGLSQFEKAVKPHRQQYERELCNVDAAMLPEALGREHWGTVDLAVTSPPYPGVHMLYHRWQVDGRRESPAPYWISETNDGQGASFYNFGGRSQAGCERYFENSLRTLHALRRLMKAGGTVVQMIAFSNIDEHLPRYLDNMEAAGFRELADGEHRIWRFVPSRRWHASLKGQTNGSTEVVLIHQAS